MFSFAKKKKAEYIAKKVREILGDFAVITVGTDNGSEKPVVYIEMLEDTFIVERGGVTVKVTKRVPVA